MRNHSEQFQSPFPHEQDAVDFIESISNDIRGISEEYPDLMLWCFDFTRQSIDEIPEIVRELQFVGLRELASSKLQVLSRKQADIINSRTIAVFLSSSNHEAISIARSATFVEAHNHKANIPGLTLKFNPGEISPIDSFSDNYNLFTTNKYRRIILYTFEEKS